MATGLHFLKIPPFPGARQATLSDGPGPATACGNAELDRLAAQVRELKVGGTYWGKQPVLPGGSYLLVRIADAAERTRQVAKLAGDTPVVEWTDTGCDPWHMLARAERLVVDSGDEAAVIGAIAGVPTELVGQASDQPLARFRAIVAADYRDPFTGEPINFTAAAELCGQWRKLIDANRDLSGAAGFALWKRRTVAPLLWNGTGHVDFAPDTQAIETGRPVAVWKSRTAPEQLSALAAKGARLVEVEDGFIRSIGLGADCVPPLSIVVDQLGIYFDPTRPSDIERILEQGEIPPRLIERARHLRHRIVALGLSKYAVGDVQLQRRSAKRHLLVTGQVEDDRAVLAGGGPATNLELLQRARADNPDAFIMYKPHPDVEAGHRPGAIPDASCLKLADEIVRDAPISSLIALADEVHVNTSLAGFEALLRDKPVITYGVPFYAGWGLCRDLGPVPARRTRRRSLDELVAAALILYPRHLDPVTGLPCPPEILIDRLSSSSLRPSDWGLVQLRRIQGQLNRAMAALRA